MYTTLFEKILSFLTHHFELLIYINGYLILLFLLVAIAIKLRDYSLRKVLLTTVRGILFTTIIAGQFVLIGMLGFLYWRNYNAPVPELNLRTDMHATTHWIKDKRRVYFITDNSLRFIQINGQGIKNIYQGNSPIIEYHFSPDGAYIVVVTQRYLVLVNQKTEKHQMIDSLNQLSGENQTVSEHSIQGTISGVHWSPDSRRLSYEMARWSKFGSQDNVYVYSIDDDSKQSIQSPTRRISSLYWDELGENLYFLRHEAQNPEISGSAFDVKVFRIALDTLIPELVTQIPFEHKSVPIESLEARGIRLYLDGSKYSFSINRQMDHLVSENGSLIGIDEDDYLYFTNSKWFRRRLFKIPREASANDRTRYQYKGGDLIIDQTRWIPGGQYVIMDHKYLGVVILEPASGQFGVLVEASGQAFGWYEKIDV